MCVLALVLLLPAAAHASDMDVALSRLRIVSGNPGCPATAELSYCPANAAFERLVSELAVTLAQPVSHGAASLGSRGFYLGVSSTGTPISATQRYWATGTVGDVRGADWNATPDALLVWNRLELRKGLPFGLELGSSIGQGIDTSMWVFGGELKWALLEGFHSGAGQLPDLAVRGTMQTTLGSRQLSLQTNTVDVTLSKPFVVGEHYRVTPFAALALLFVRASTGRIDLTPDVNAFACKPAAASGAHNGASTTTGSVPQCTSGDATTQADVQNYATFEPVSQTRTRMFLGVEGAEHWFTMSLAFAFDLTTPTLNASTPNDGFTTTLPHQFSLHLALGARY